MTPGPAALFFCLLGFKSAFRFLRRSRSQKYDKTLVINCLPVLLSHWLRCQKFFETFLTTSNLNIKAFYVFKQLVFAFVLQETPSAPSLDWCLTGPWWKMSMPTAFQTRTSHYGTRPLQPQSSLFWKTTFSVDARRPHSHVAVLNIP